MHRWYVFALLLMRRQSLGMRGVIFLLCGLPPLLLAAAFLGAAAAPTRLAACALGAVLAVRALILSGLQLRLSGAVRHRPLLSVLSELLQPLHLVHAVCVRRIRWRSRRYRVIDNDRFVAE
jgi:ceramide glucosyltransferase